MNWTAFKQDYPHPRNRGDMARAESRFNRIVKVGELDALLKALEAYIAEQESPGWHPPYMQLSTWLGSEKAPRWRDWLPEEPQPKSLIEIAEEREARRRYNLQRAPLIQREIAKSGRVRTIEEIVWMLEEGCDG